MGVGAGPYMYVVVVQKFTFAISSPDEFLYTLHVTACHVTFRSPSVSIRLLKLQALDLGVKKVSNN